MGFQVFLLAMQLFYGFNRNTAGSPDLRMRVRIAATHHPATVFEYLHVGDVRPFIELFEFFRKKLQHPG